MSYQEKEVYWSYGQFFIEASPNPTDMILDEDLTDDQTHSLFENGIRIFLYDDDIFEATLRIHVDEPVSSEGEYVCSTLFETPGRRICFYPPDGPPDSDEVTDDDSVKVNSNRTFVTVFKTSQLHYDVFFNAAR